MKKSTITWIVVAAVVVLILLIIWGSYNSLVSADVTVDEKWANVESSYQRRMDLIPNLVSTVQGAVDFEQDTQTQIAALRSSAVAAKAAIQNAQTFDESLEAIQQSDQVLSAYRGLNINVENYPQLKATENFLSLQDELAGTENRINFARNEYNTAVKQLNAKIRKFPSNIVARMFNFEQRESFEAMEGAEVAPTVSFE